MRPITLTEGHLIATQANPGDSNLGVPANVLDGSTVDIHRYTRVLRLGQLLPIVGDKTGQRTAKTQDQTARKTQLTQPVSTWR